MNGRKTGGRLQSAMEYLMTYGWSILIIAVVLAAMFELGVFGNQISGPRAPINSCRVYRPYGVGSTASLNLEGVCNILPQYVAKFNGVTSYVSMSPSILNGVCTGTVSMWFNRGSWPNSGGGYITLLTKSDGAAYVNNHIQISQDSTGNTIVLEIGNDIATTGGSLATPTISQNVWYQIVLTWNGASLVGYLNGVNIGSISTTICEPSDSTLFAIGEGAESGRFFNGSIANVQAYNTALDPTSINAIYADGIGGAPVNLQNLVAWWPLNGDTNDYSGNGNNGVPANLVFTSTWTTGYTTP